MAKPLDKSFFKELGLTANETEIYLTLLKSGPITVNEIAQRSGLHRQVVYDSLERLLEKGYVAFVVENHKKFFHAIGPETIKMNLLHQVNRFKTLLPSLLSLEKKSMEQNSIEVFKGKNIYKIVYDDIFKTLLREKSKEVLVTGIEEKKFMDVDALALEQHLLLLRKHKMLEKKLVREGDTCLVEGSQTLYKWVPAEFFNPNPQFIYGGSIALIIWGEPNYALIIKNRHLAEQYRKQFTFIWRISRPPKYKADKRANIYKPKMVQV
ncbi:helix-turn-helix domain-containing protein [Candidatus Woesearchaeota archaeon]|nr:helix-turn-helix domain-containing protein [Candidatus Woesearchaeota archaeon]